MRIFGAGSNALVFIGTTYAVEVEHKHHDLTEEKLQKARDKWNEDRMKQLDFFEKSSVKEMKQ